jgi:spermidine synthase
VAAPAEPAVSRNPHGFLYFTAAVTGAAIMIIEILGAKLLSPFFGMSHFVWTAQIAVTLVALACGYYVGGRVADRYQQLSRLYWALLAAAVYLCIVVLVCEPIAYWCLDFNLAVGSLLASTILFFIPLALLAMTGPFLVRMITSSVAGVGGNVGRLTSIGTMGSFAGTILIGYLMIPLLPNSTTMYLTALALMLICVVYFVAYQRKWKGPLLVCLCVAIPGYFVLLSEQKPHFQFMEELFRGNSNFGRLQVFEDQSHRGRYYLNDNLFQNTYDPESGRSESAFTYMLSGLARAYTTNISDVLCIGLGVGIVPMDFARQGARVDVVEINPAVVPVARRFFGLDPDKLHITIDDGRHFLNRCQRKYDAVALDAFLGDSSPSHLMTREAFESIRRVLRPGGVLVINSFTELEEGHDYFANSLSKTLKAVFKGVRMHTQGRGAIFFVATDHPDPVFVHAPDLSNVHPRAQYETETAFKNLVEASPERGRVLTDNFNPVEFYDAPNREAIRRRLAMSAKEM